MADMVTPSDTQRISSGTEGQIGSTLNQTIDEERTSQQIEDMAISDDDNLEISF